jgi:hypothetical protein
MMNVGTVSYHRPRMSDKGYNRASLLVTLVLGLGLVSLGLVEWHQAWVPALLTGGLGGSVAVVSCLGMTAGDGLFRRRNRGAGSAYSVSATTCPDGHRQRIGDQPGRELAAEHRQRGVQALPP